MVSRGYCRFVYVLFLFKKNLTILLFLRLLPLSLKNKSSILLIREVQSCDSQALKGRGGLRSGNNPAPGEPPRLISLPLLSAGLKKSSEKKTEDSRSLGTSPRRCSSRGTRAPVKFSLSKTSTARTGGLGGCHHMWLPTPPPRGEPVRTPVASEWPRRAVPGHHPL